MAGDLPEGDGVAGRVGETAGREQTEFQGEEPDGEQPEPEGRGGFEGVRGGADAPVEQSAGPAGGQYAEAGAEEHRDGERGGGEQYGPAQAFTDDIGDGLAHHGGVAEVAAERRPQPVPPAAHEGPVDTEVGPELVEVLLRGGEPRGPRVRLDRVEGEAAATAKTPNVTAARTGTASSTRRPAILPICPQGGGGSLLRRPVLDVPPRAGRQSVVVRFDLGGEGPKRSFTT